MARLRRLVALVRVLLVALALCLLGAARAPARDTADPTLGPQPAHVDAVDPHAPDAAREERDEDPQASADRHAKPPPRPALAPPSSADRRAIMVRGPPGEPLRVGGRPRSSRGPPPRV